jgi:hypothetical protein
MNRILQIKNFNGLLEQFFDFLENTFPDYRSDIILTRSTADFIRKSNPRLVVEQFMENVGPYKKYIFDCNEDFFINFEMSTLGLSKENFLFGMKLKQMWISSNITDMDKAKVFYYFQKLLKAGELCSI